MDAMVIRGWKGRREYLRAALAVAALNRGVGHDVVHAHYGHSGLVGRLQLRAPLVVTYHGSDLLGNHDAQGRVGPVRRLEAGVMRNLARYAAATITQNEEMEQLLPPSCRARNHVVPMGTDLDEFRPIPRDQARELLGWGQDERVVLFVGDPDRPVKNYPLAEQAVERLARTTPQARLRVLSGRPPSEVPVWMSASDALLLTSHSEGSPNVVREAMASELPVVSTPVGDVAERISGLPACHVEPADPEALALALADSIAHGRVPEARSSVAPFDMASTARKVISVYESVLRGRRGRRPSHSPQRPGA